MIFHETRLPGAYIVDMERKADERGFNARLWCRREFEEAGLETRLSQSNIVLSTRRGTLRGLHYQRPPHAETKLFRCTRGAFYDVIVDLRPSSPTFKEWVGVELRPDSYQMLYVPEGFAQGTLSLEDGSELTYHVSEFYTPGHEGGVRYDDPTFGIDWPIDVSVISDKDRSWPKFSEAP
jgi:dTDP-4-dehydrorhamnose 3,5-epimerase